MASLAHFEREEECRSAINDLMLYESSMVSPVSIIASPGSKRIYIEDIPNEDRFMEDSEIDDWPI